jgi:hypothetical protein
MLLLLLLWLLWNVLAEEIRVCKQQLLFGSTSRSHSFMWAQREKVRVPLAQRFRVSGPLEILDCSTEKHTISCES